jgi:hypothetical protein
LLCARLREAEEESAAGCVEELSRIVAQVRAAWPEGRIVLRGDSGFCREAIMSWCEIHRVEYVLGLANPTFSTGGGSRPGRRIDPTVRRKGLHYNGCSSPF